MCNLYSMTRNREAILRLFRVSHNRAATYEPRDAIFPGYQAPVVRKAADGERELAVLNWGFVLLQKDKALGSDLLRAGRLPQGGRGLVKTQAEAGRAGGR